jgi:hypothetical protein
LLPSSAAVEDEATEDESFLDNHVDGQDPYHHHEDGESGSETSEQEPTNSSRQSTQRRSNCSSSRTKPSKSSKSRVLTEQGSQNREQRRAENHRNSFDPKMVSTRKSSASKEPPAKPVALPTKKTSADVIAELRAKLNAFEKEKANITTQFQAKLDKLKAKSKAKSGGSGAKSKIPLGKEMKDRVSDVVNEYLWRNTKFLANDEELAQACFEVMTQIPGLDVLVAEDNDEQEENIQAMVQVYGADILSKVNGLRNDAQSGIRKAYIKRAMKDLPMPTPAQLLSVIMREGLEIDPEDPDKNKLQREWHLWYVDELLPKIAFSRWGYSVRNYGIISEHAPPDDPTTKYITSSDEAMVVILWENTAQRLPYQVQCKKAGIKWRHDHKEYVAKYSCASAGQAKWGGWNLAGRVRYGKLRSSIIKAKRKDPKAVKRVEKATLKALQSKNGLTAKKSKKRKDRVPQDFEGKQEAMVQFVESDEEQEILDASDVEVEEFDALFPEPKKSKRGQPKNDDSDEESEEESEKENAGN